MKGAPAAVLSDKPACNYATPMGYAAALPAKDAPMRTNATPRAGKSAPTDGKDDALDEKDAALDGKGDALDEKAVHRIAKSA